jgi:hypothetical protein
MRLRVFRGRLFACPVKSQAPRWKTVELCRAAGLPHDTFTLWPIAARFATNNATGENGRLRDSPKTSVGAVPFGNAPRSRGVLPGRAGKNAWFQVTAFSGRARENKSRKFAPYFRGICTPFLGAFLSCHLPSHARLAIILWRARSTLNRRGRGAQDTKPVPGYAATRRQTAPNNFRTFSPHLQKTARELIV